MLVAPPNRLIVKADEVKTTIILTEAEAINQGRVISAGADLDPFWADQLVIWKKYAGQEIQVDGVTYRSILLDEVLGILV